MYKIATLQTLRKSFVPLCSRSLSERGICNAIFQQQHILSNKNIQLNSRYESSLSHEVKPNFFQRTKERLFNYISMKTKNNIAGVLVYEKLADNINYEEFFEKFDLPDTFQSWFLAVQLHVWMCIIATVAENNGRDFRNGLVDAMWHDVEMRLNHLAEMKSSRKKKYLKDLVAQFNAAVLSYDEAILDERDTVLAAAAWRTLFSFKNVDPQMLENIVFYIRKQISHIDSLNLEKIMIRGIISFKTLKDIFESDELK